MDKLTHQGEELTCYYQTQLLLAKQASACGTEPGTSLRRSSMPARAHTHTHTQWGKDEEKGADDRSVWVERDRIWEEKEQGSERSFQS